MTARFSPRKGKQMGGSSGMNLQAIVPFSASDVDAWEQLGNAGWNWKTLGHKLQKLFTVTLPDDPIAKHLHLSWAESIVGVPDRPLKASFPGVLDNPVGKAWVETFEELGFPLTASPFSGHSRGAYNAAASIDPENVTRSYSNTGYYLEIASRANLKVFNQAVAGKILLQDHAGPTATGVQFTKDGNITTINARKEVILCAGSSILPRFSSSPVSAIPKFLAPTASRHKSRIRYVGTNLQDHALLAIRYECADDVSGDSFMPTDPIAGQAGMARYQKDKTGALASSGVTSFAYLNVASLAADPAAESTIVDTVKNTEGSHPLDSARRSSCFVS